MKDAMVQCINVSFKYIKNTEEGKTEEKYAVRNVNLQENKGEFLVVLGHNGSGKSTVAKHMNALLIPTEGTVIVNGLDTTDENNVLLVETLISAEDALTLNKPSTNKNNTNTILFKNFINTPFYNLSI